MKELKDYCKSIFQKQESDEVVESNVIANTLKSSSIRNVVKSSIRIPTTSDYITAPKQITSTTW